VAGPNPYTLHSFRELRAIMGRAWVVCHPCLRFVELRVRDDRDTRITTFSCCLCGREGKLTFDDPAKQGLQYDPRPRPPRHPDRVLRLQQIARLNDSFGHRGPGREDLPQRERPRREPALRYRLVPLPFVTFREAFDFGLVLRLYCPECHRREPLCLGPELLDRSFPGARFICKHERMKRVRRRHRGLQQSGGADPPSASEHLSATAGHRPAPRPAAGRSSPV